MSEVDEPEETPNGEDEPHSGLSTREILQRVDSRSLETRRSVDLLGRDVIRLTSDVAGLRSSSEGFRKDLANFGVSLARVERRIAGVRRDADDSGEHIRQELEEVRKALAEKEHEELESKLAAAQKQVDDAKALAEQEERESRKRRRDLVWKLLEWSAIAILTATSTHFFWR